MNAHIYIAADGSTLQILNFLIKLNCTILSYISFISKTMHLAYNSALLQAINDAFKRKFNILPFRIILFLYVKHNLIHKLRS